MNIRHPKYYHDEVWNTLSHGLGFILAVTGSVYLLWAACHALHISELVSVSIYLAGALFVYASSTAYHAAPPGLLKQRLQTVDHISIFVMIAGTHTPIIMRYFNNQEGYIFLAVMWSLALLGSIFKVMFKDKLEILSVILYVGMGSLSIVFGPEMYELISPTILSLIITGGVLYFIGVIFYLWETLPYNHPIWHLFVMAASILHFIAIDLMIIGK